MHTMPPWNWIHDHFLFKTYDIICYIKINLSLYASCYKPSLHGINSLSVLNTNHTAMLLVLIIESLYNARYNVMCYLCRYDTLRV